MRGLFCVLGYLTYVSCSSQTGSALTRRTELYLKEHEHIRGYMEGTFCWSQCIIGLFYSTDKAADEAIRYVAAFLVRAVTNTKFKILRV